MGEEPFVTPADSSVLTINGGSSSMWFALYDAGEPLRLLLDGKVDRIGLSGTNLIVNDPAGKPQVRHSIDAADHRTAVGFLLDWLETQQAFASVKAVGHRVVHGMTHSEPERGQPEWPEEFARTTTNKPG